MLKPNQISILKRNNKGEMLQIKSYFIAATIEKEIKFYIPAYNRDEATRKVNNHINNSKHGIFEVKKLDVEEVAE